MNGIFTKWDHFYWSFCTKFNHFYRGKVYFNLTKNFNHNFIPYHFSQQTNQLKVLKSQEHYNSVPQNQVLTVKIRKINRITSIITIKIVNLTPTDIFYRISKIHAMQKQRKPIPQPYEGSRNLNRTLKEINKIKKYFKRKKIYLINTNDIIAKFTIPLWTIQ